MKIKAIVVRILQQFIRDKRSLALLLFAPLLILTLTWLVLDNESTPPTIATINIPEHLSQVLEESDMQIDEIENPFDALRNSEIDAVVEWQNNKVQITVDDSEPNAKQIKIMLQQAFSAANTTPDQSIQTNYYYGIESATTFDYVGPVLIGFFSFFFVFLIGGISFLREKSRGTLERLFAMPLKGWEMITGYIIGFGICAILQSIIVVLFAVYVVNIPLQGSIFYVMLITLLLALCALTLGIWLSTFAKNEFQIMQFIPIVIVPQAFFSGLFNLENAPVWVEAIGKIMPISYGANALTEVMIKGNGFEAIQTDIIIILGFSILFFLLNLGTLKAYRK
ncbi:ABC transporter permease [Radiobacillus sp. PE A8.2]|uniref:ABC transporter permease n=1 Tax=Radiobacillus sp. PE A8.2 TaxID=3380349 RepID=UPI00388D218D